MNEPLISIYIPYYNAEKSIRLCLDSVLAQTYENLEIIAVNNNSTDESESIVREYAEKDARIRMINCTIQGLSATRNAGIAACHGEWITGLDSDDVMLPDCIRNLFDTAMERHADLVMGSFYRTFSYDGILPERDDLRTLNTPVEITTEDHSEMVKYFFGTGHFYCYAWGKLFYKDLFKDVVYPVNMIYEDSAVIFKILENCHCLTVVNIPTIYYVQHADSLSRIPNFDRQMDLLTVTVRNAEYATEFYPESVPQAYDTVLDAVFYLLGVASRNHISKKDPRFERLVEAARTYSPKASKASMTLKGGAFLVKISPRFAGKMFALYSKLKNHM